MTRSPRMMSLVLVCGAAASISACGTDTTGGPATDTVADTAGDTTDTTAPTDTRPDTTLDTTTPDTTTPDTSTPDTTTPDTTADTSGDTNTSGCSRTGFTGEAYFEHDAEFGYTTFGLENDTSFFGVEFYDFGDGSPLTGPGNYPIGANADDQNYETCTTCLLIYADCTTETCDKAFFATGGTIEVSAIDLEAGTVTATVRNIIAVEVTIDENTFASTPVAGGETWCLPSVVVAP